MDSTDPNPIDPTILLQNVFDVDRLLAEREWKPLREGVNISIIYECDNNGPVAALLHYAPGASVPEHRHLGFEHILILRGSQEDANHHYKTGTLAIQSPGVTHCVQAPDGCVALAIWEKPVAFLSA